MLPINKNSIYQYDLEKLFFHNLLKNNKDFKLKIEQKQENYRPINEFVEDIYASLYKYKPEIVDEDTMSSDYLLNHMIIESLFSNLDYKQLRNYTLGDISASFIGAEMLYKQFVPLIDKYKNETYNLTTNLAIQSKNTEKTEAVGGVELNQSTDDNIISYEEAQRQLEMLKQMRQEIKQGLEVKIRNILSNIYKQFTEVLEGLKSWSLLSGGDYYRTSYIEKIELWDKIKNNKKIIEILKLLGKFDKLFNQVQESKIKTTQSIETKILQGIEISNLLPSEMLYLLPELENLFYKKYTEEALWLYKTNNEENSKTGPLIICLDSSGSMSDLPEQWSKAIALAFINKAREQQRNLYLLQFSSIGELHINKIEYNKNNDNEILDFLTFFYGHGTDFETPLNKAREIISSELDFKKADILFITDGEAVITEQWTQDYKNWLQKHNITLYTIFIDCTDYNTKSLSELSSQSILLNNILNSDSAIQIFQLL